MRILKIADVCALEDGETVPSVRGRLTAIYDRKSGQNDRGAYSFQNAELDDGSGKIKVKLKDRDALLPVWKGKLVVISCNESKTGLTGVKAADDEYKGKISRILWVTPSAHIDLAEADNQQAPAEPTRQSAPASQPAKAPNGNGHAPAPATGHAPGNGQPTVRQRLNRLANLYLASLDAGMYVARTFEEQAGEPMSGEHFQACVSSLFIQATRENLQDQIAGGKYQP